jgi:hypothetical protein
MDEDLEKREIEAMPVMRSLRFHAAQKKNKAGYRANLRCGCGVQQVGPIRMSSKYPRLLDNVMFFLSFSWCAEALCEAVVQLLVQGMLACARSRTRIEVLRSKSRGARLYAYQADLLD